jgi:hypothetical protein
MNLLGFGNQKLPTVIKDPFSKDKVTEVHVWMSVSWEGKWQAHGRLKFTNGNTTGEQSYTGSSFDEVVLKIKQTVENL